MHLGLGGRACGRFLFYSSCMRLFGNRGLKVDGSLPAIALHSSYLLWSILRSIPSQKGSVQADCLEYQVIENTNLALEDILITYLGSKDMVWETLSVLFQHVDASYSLYHYELFWYLFCICSFGPCKGFAQQRQKEAQKGMNVGSLRAVYSREQRT